MAFKSAPTEDTYSSAKVALSREISARDGGQAGKDEDLFNVFIEPIKNKETSDRRHFVVKRSGSTQVVAEPGAGEVRGWFFWEDRSLLLYAVTDDIYIYNVQSSTTVATLTAAFGTTTGDVGFCLFQYEDGTSKVVATDGTTLMTIDSAYTKVVSADADMPLHRPYPIFLDGYVFVSKTGTADLYNSELNDPLSWIAGDFINAEMEGDNIYRIAKLNNYIVAFGAVSIEYFWDAAIATGSPLQRNDTPVKYNGYMGGFAQRGNSIYFIGQSEGGQPGVFMLKDFKIEEVSTPTISRYLNRANSAISTWKGNIVAFKGHTFYVMNAGTEKTYVLDLETKLWARWGWQTNDNFNMYNSIMVTNLANTYCWFTVGTSALIHRFNDILYQDNGVTFSCVITTEAEDFGTMNRKTMRKATLIGDRPNSTASITITWSDDDGITFNSGLATDLKQDMPCVYRLGSFRQRVFKLTYTANQDLRLQEMEVEINKGRS